jgi:MFS family permease
LVTLASALTGFALDGGIFAVIYNLYLLRLHYSPEAIGQINSAAEMTLAITALPMGMLGSRWGSRPMLVLGAVGMVLGALVTALTGWMSGGWQLSGLIGGKGLLYLGIAAFYVNQVPFTIAATEEQDRASVFAAQSALSHGGAFVGALLGGALPGWYVRWLGGSLGDAAPYSAPLWVVVGTMVVMMLLALWTHSEKATSSETRPNAPQGAPSPAIGFMALLVVMTVVRFFHVGGIGAMTTFINVYLDQELKVQTANIGWIAAITRLVAIPVVLLVPWLSRRWPRQWVSFWGAMGAACCALPLALIPIWWVAGASYVLLQAAVTVRYSTFIVYLMELTPPRQRGIVAGAGEMAAGLSVAVAALLGGYVIANQGYRPLFLSAGLAIALGTLLFGVYVWRRNTGNRADR